ncbi:MAG TPA: demethylmenaquinone methyltransferase [Streptosporangiaceae bacterium]|jgi:demethylmenaquinone methyltransferase/2-methoxy-6-polyprenyl-1,4-benzoquinol methylase|nr:demethylmenaquinone methyltransferase [Streptosporangiaceae bacterium]
MTRADLDKQPGDVAAMFDGIAERYDLLNDILSAGQVRLWRRAVARIIGSGPGDRVLDLAAGTGTSALSFTATGADCVACDFSLGMLRAGQSQRAGRTQRGAGRLGLAAGDALRLPFRDEAFDAVTISFGLRNVASPGAALAEMRRVTRPGGRLVVCEFSTITIAPLDMLYRRYLINILPEIARRTARHPEAYQYLAESIADWPAQRELAGVIEAAGWSAVRWRDLSLGVVAVHVARRAPDASGRPG